MIPARHRLGVITDEIKNHVLEARKLFRTELPEELQGAVEFFDADAYNKGPVANDVAKKLLDEALAVDDAEAKLKASYAPKILKALPATKAARYIQIENKIRAALRYELAAGIPLVE